MGVSLEEIKTLIDNDSSSEAMLEMTKRQKKSIRSKIEELELMEEQLTMLEEKINDSMRLDFNQIKVVDNPERTFVKYKEGHFTPEEIEMLSREVILETEGKLQILEHDITFTVSYEDVLKNKVVYKTLSVEMSRREDIAGADIVTEAQGQYVTMYFEDSSNDNRDYYNQIICFAENHQIELVGDFIETALVLRVNRDGQEKTLAKLEIRCK